MKKGYFAIKLRYLGYTLILLWNVMLLVGASNSAPLWAYDLYGNYNGGYFVLAFLLANWLVAFLIMFYFEVVKGGATCRVIRNADQNQQKR
jgi:hypothetical protein